jgi:hypothetical protein
MGINTVLGLNSDAWRKLLEDYEKSPKIKIKYNILSGHYEKDKNTNAPIQFKKFKHRCYHFDKSHLVKKEDIEVCSISKKENSISFIEAIRLRWKFCIPYENGKYGKYQVDVCHPAHYSLKDFDDDADLLLKGKNELVYFEISDVISSNGNGKRTKDLHSLFKNEQNKNEKEKKYYLFSNPLLFGEEKNNEQIYYACLFPRDPHDKDLKPKTYLVKEEDDLKKNKDFKNNRSNHYFEIRAILTRKYLEDHTVGFCVTFQDITPKVS